MATTAGPSTAPRGQTAPESYDPPGTGWVTFAATMVAVAGAVNIIYGIAAISDSRFYFQDVTYIISNLNTYGWLSLALGALQAVAAFAIFNRATWARWVGILSAAVNMVVQLVFLPAYPLASLAIMALDILVVYGLIAHGKHARAAL
jgi:hypothetical protein